MSNRDDRRDRGSVVAALRPPRGSDAAGVARATLVAVVLGLLAACGGSPNTPATQTRTAEIIELSVVARGVAAATTPPPATPTLANTSTTAIGNTSVPSASAAAPTGLLPTRGATSLPTRAPTTPSPTSAERGGTVVTPALRTPAASTPGSAQGGARVPFTPNAAGTLQAGRVTQRVTVIRLTDNAKDSSGLNPPSRASNKYFTIEVILANTGTAPLLRSATAWRVQTTAGNEAPDTIPTGLGQPLEFGTLAPGATLQGVVAFEVPAGETVRWIRYRYSDGAVVGDLYFDIM